MGSDPQHADDQTRQRTGLRRRMVCDGLLAAVLLWPVVVLIWPDRPYVMDIITTWVHLWVGVCAVAALAGFLLHRYVLGGAAAFAMVLVATMVIAARHPMADQATPQSPGMKLRVISFNMHGHLNDDPNAFIDWTLSKKPDVVVIIEPADVIKQNPRLLAELPYTAGGRAPYPPMYSRYPIQPLRMKTWDEQNNARSGVHFCGYEVRPNDANVFYVVPFHAHSPRRPSSWSQNRVGLELANRYAVTLRDEMGGPMMICGDFNATPSTASMEWFRQQRVLRDTNRNGLDRGTWPAWAPSWLAAQIDYVFVSREFAVVHSQVGPNLGSDHRPILTDLVLNTTTGY